MINLLEETLEALNLHGKSSKDVKWVCSDSSWTDWEGFAESAKTTDYDNGYGTQFIRPDLKLVGKGFWFERAEYDGSEEWVLKEYPTKPRLKLRLIPVRISEYLPKKP